MRKRSAAYAFAVAVAVVTAAASPAFAQECYERAGEGTAPTRDEALRLAYEATLKATDQRLWQTWSAGARRVGDAPGWTVRKMTSNCAAGGAGQTCRIMVTLCRQ
jgi:hypothetical protein